MKIEDKYWIKRKGYRALDTVKIVEITKKTVLLDIIHSCQTSYERYSKKQMRKMIVEKTT